MRYVATDPYLVFWHRFIADIRARGLATLRAPEELWTTYIEPRLDQYIGGVFEEASRTFVSLSRHPDLPFQPVQVGSWWTKDGQEEVDVVALGSEGEVLFGEARWGHVSGSDLEALTRRSELVLPHLKGVRSVHYALFSSRGLEDGATRARASDDNVLYFSLDHFFDLGP